MTNDNHDSQSLFEGRTPSAPSGPEEKPKSSGTLGKVFIVVALIIIVGMVFALKRKQSKAGSPSGVPPGVGAQPASQPTKSVPRLLDLGSVSCIPCKMMAPILEELRKEYAGKLQVDFIDVNQDREAAVRFGIGVIPTQIFQDASGSELFRHEGFFAKEDILAKWRELGVNLKPAAAPGAK